MILPAHLLGLNQRLDFTSGTISNVLSIRLPNGAVIDATVASDHLRPIMDAFAESQVNGGVAPPPAAPPPPQQESLQTFQEEPLHQDPEFGDVGTFGGPPAPAPRQSTLATGPVPTTVTRPAPARTVARNEAGYPVLSGGVDPSRVLGEGPDTDEDGVAQA